MNDQTLMIKLADYVNEVLANKNLVVERYLGAGCFGVVFKVYNKITMESFACKTFRLNQFINNRKTGEQINKSITQEIEIMRSLVNIDLVVRYYDHLVNDEYYMLIMELCPSGNLNGYTRKHGSPGLSIEEIRIISRSILIGLYHLHNRNIIHRDIKPENIFINLNDNKYNIKIGDLGLAYVLDSGSDYVSKSSIAGTPIFFPPEIIDGTSGNSKSSDIWSYGMTILFMYFGRVIFSISRIGILNNEEITTSFNNRNHDKNINELISFVINCLQVSPSERSDCQTLLNHPFIKTNNDNDLLTSVMSNKSDNYIDSNTSKEMMGSGNIKSQVSRSNDLIPIELEPLRPKKLTESAPPPSSHISSVQSGSISSNEQIIIPQQQYIQPSGYTYINDPNNTISTNTITQPLIIKVDTQKDCYTTCCSTCGKIVCVILLIVFLIIIFGAVFGQRDTSS